VAVLRSLAKPWPWHVTVGSFGSAFVIGAPDLGFLFLGFPFRVPRLISMDVVGP
jgi:hypothetical protein